jgi:LuxR family transcriptional regulator, regulator of acetate metabolism
MTDEDPSSRVRATAGAARRLREVQLALQRLAGMNSVERIVAAAPHELCLAAGFERAMFSYLRADRVVFGSVSDDAHPIMAADFARLARAVRPRLERCGPEHEAVVRQMPLLVRDAQRAPNVFHPLAHFARTEDYVVAPVVHRGQTVGLLHADRFNAAKQLDELDREILWTFAAGVGWIVDRLRGLESADAGRKRQDGAEDLGAGDAHGSVSGAEIVNRLARLTSRELEVLRLMAEGASNAAIGEALVISQATVKSHVRHILRKLGARNRTEAVSQFLATGAGVAG